MIMQDLNRDENGGVLVEITVMIPIIFVLVLGAIDFLFAFYQWNVAAKAVEVGARIAAVSTPVANGLNSLRVSSASVIDISVAMPYFKVTCDGAGSSSGSCTCSGTCTGVAGYSSAAMNTIVFGRGSSGCHDGTSIYDSGMCDFFDRITPGNVRVVYEQTGLGYDTRPAGPVPTITVSLRNLPFQFFFLGGLLRFANISNIPASATITGEDLCSKPRLADQTCPP